MVKVKNFHEGLEQNISRLGLKVNEVKRNPEMKNESPQKIVKKAIEDIHSEVLEKEGIFKAEIETQNTEKSKNYNDLLPSYLLKSELDSEVKKIILDLINLALENGVEEAIKKSRLYSPFIIDAFHDALVEKMLPELKKKGYI